MTARDPFSRAALRAYTTRLRPRWEGHLATLVELPSVSADPARARDVRRTADVAASLIRSLGGEAHVVPTGGHPLVHHRR